jgi:two-component system, OmpR family, sensor histidine kinase KdpD
MARGTLRIYLGAAPGVGKTFSMLGEGRRRAERGTDVVVGLVETHGRPKTAEQVDGLEVIPRRTVEYRGTTFEEMDVDAILARRPEVALVDELAHTNVPGCRHAKRWEDVEALLDAGITVVSTLNIQHLESVNDVVEQITGVKQRETIPDAVVRRADQIELVDMAPEAIRRRMAHGNIYPSERVDAALGNYFRTGNLGALRELALLWVADRVDDALQDYRERHGIDRPWETRERVIVALTGSADGERLVRRAARMAARAKGELIAVHVRPQDGLTAGAAERLDEQRRLVDELGGTYREIVGADIGDALVAEAHALNATQIVLGATRRSRLAELTRGSVINRVIAGSGVGLDVHVISRVDQGTRATTGRRTRHPGSLPRRRVALGFALAAVGLPLLTWALTNLRHHFGLPSVLLLFLLLVVVVSAVGGVWPALAAAVAGFLLVNWYFTPPVHTFTIAQGENLLALSVFLAVAVVVSTFVSLASRRAAEGARDRAEAEALARLAGSSPVGDLLDSLRRLLGLDAAVLYRRTGAGWRVEAASGGPVPDEPGERPGVAVDDERMLVPVGLPSPTGTASRILDAFAREIGSSLILAQLQAEASEAGSLAAAGELRTAILSAVSHDLRTPLAGIKASVTSLLQDDVEWPPEATREFLVTIDEESDRLNALVGNLLDMSRIQTGSLDVSLTAVGVDEVIPAALASLGPRAERVDVDVDESHPRVLADPGLLERALANVIANAVAHAPAATHVRVVAGAAGGGVDVRVVDRGPGVPAVDRERMFRPFQRLGDAGGGDGVGLGLAVARGFVEAMGGEIEAEDTPGGGLTMVLRLRAAG